MTKEKRSKSTEQLVPYPDIEAAMTGDAEAVYRILQHYDRYITKLSLESVIDYEGKPRMVVNQDLKEYLQEKLRQ